MGRKFDFRAAGNRKTSNSTPLAFRPARKHYRQVCERPNKGNKAIEREVLSSYQIAQSFGFKGDFRAREQLLRIHE